MFGVEHLNTIHAKRYLCFNFADGSTSIAALDAEPTLVGKANSMEAYSVAHLIAVRHIISFCGAPVKMRHRIRLFCGALLIGAPQNKIFCGAAMPMRHRICAGPTPTQGSVTLGFILWRSHAHAPQNKVILWRTRVHAPQNTRIL